MAAPTKVELSVEMTCDGCVRAVRNVLDTLPGVKSVEINLDKEQVIVESSLPSSKLVEVIESTGKRAVLTGYGSAKVSKNLGAAVALIEVGNRLIQGVVRFVQSDDRVCVIEGTIDGLTPGNHAVCVHELGDLSNGCDSCGDVFPGLNGDSDQSYGEIVDVTAEENGRAVFRVEKTNFSVWDVIGRSMVIHQGNLEFLRSKGQGNSRLACGIIARSAGVFENSKKICACDGVSLWDERNVPVAGPARQSKLS